MNGWPADAIERRPPASLTPYGKNARLHSDAQISQLVASFDEFGFVSPVLVDEAGVLIAGHGRHAAALRLGLAEIPVMVARGWSEAKKRRFRLLDNKVAENSTWDEDLLGLELGELRDDGVDLLGLGFDDADLTRLLDLGLGDDDGAEPAAEPSRAGNLSARFGISPFSVLSARDGWWQDRKRAWLALGIQSELGRGADTFNSNDRMAALQATGDSRTQDHHSSGDRAARKAAPGGNHMPATNYSKSGAKGDGAGRAIPGTRKRKANAVPGGGPMPLDRKKGA